MIFYFSATDNCKRIAEGLGRGDVVSMTAGKGVLDAAPGLAPNEPIGFMFPTYFWGLPTVVAEFLREAPLPDCAGRYVFVVASYGTTSGGATQMARGFCASGVSRSLPPMPCHAGRLDARL